MNKKWKKKITIIILSLNRPKYLRRTVDYYLEIGLKLIVVDGSKKKNKFKDHKNLTYINSNKHYYSRLAIAEKKLKTQYYIIANDDEFFLENGLRKCVNFLEKNSSFIGACGRSLVFFYLKKKFLAYEGYKYFYKNKLNNKIKTDRVKVHTNLPTVQGYNSVLRKKVLSKIVNFLSNYRITDNIFLKEFFINLIIILSGRLHVINHLMWFRSQENKIITTKTWRRSGKMQNFYIYFNSISTNKKKYLFKKFCQISKELKLYDLILSGMISRSKNQYQLYLNNNFKKKSFKNILGKTIIRIKNSSTYLNNLGEFIKVNLFYKKYYGEKLDNLLVFFFKKKLKFSYKNINTVTNKIKHFYND
jgi:glycosyltransferase domain-containing protein